MKIMPKSKKNQRPIDKAAKEAFSWWGRGFIFIQRTQVKTWQGIFIMAFIAGTVSTLLWTISNDWHPFSKAAGTSIYVPVNSCVAMPAGGYYSQPTKVLIKCGDRVDRAYYQWNNSAPVLIRGGNSNTVYQAKTNMNLKITGRYKEKSRYGYGYGANYGYGYGYNNGWRTFTLSYTFKAQQRSSCIDSDNGINIFTKGAVMSTICGGNYSYGYGYGDSGCRKLTSTDRCASTNNVLEYYCDKRTNKPAVVNQKCPAGNVCRDGACVKNTPPPPTIPPQPTCPVVTIGNTKYRLEPCSINMEMTDGQGNKDISFKIVQEGSKAVYGFSVLGYGAGFPTYGIMGGYASGGAQGSLTMNKYFNDNVLSANGTASMRYVGYLPIKIYHGSATATNQKELRLNINLLVKPKIIVGTNLLYLGRDNVYYMCAGKPQGANKELNIDLTSVKILDNTFFKDKNKVYIANADGHSQVCSFNIVPNADPNTFKVLNKYYEKDWDTVYGNSFYWGGPWISIIKNAHAETFVSLGRRYAKDKNTAYFAEDQELIIITSSDPQTFKVLEDNNYATDKNYKYYQGKILSPVSISNCPKPYHVLTSDNRCVWSCGTGTTPNNMNNECVCKPGYAQYGIDQFGRRICREVVQGTGNSLY